MVGWYKVEGLILSKIGVFSYFYFGLLNYIPFLLFFSLCLIAICIFNQSKYAKKGKSGAIIGCKKISFIVYGTVFFAWIGVALYDLIVHFYIQNSIPSENVGERLSFLIKPEIVAIEGFIKYSFFLIIPLLFLIKDRGIRSLVGLRSRHLNIKRSFVLYIFYLSAILISMYLISKISIFPRSEKYFSLVSVFQGLRNKSPMFSYTYTTLMVILISFSKELLFRGFIYSCLRENIGIKYAFILQCLLFSLYHQNSDGVLICFIVGIFLTLLYQQTKSIYFPIVVHGSLLFLIIILNI